MKSKDRRHTSGVQHKTASKPLLHPPLSQVAFEVNFPNSFAVETGIASYQQRVEAVYPKSGGEYIVRFPSAVAFGKPPKPTAAELTPLRSFVFQNPAGSRIVRVSVVSFSLVVTDYLHFEDYTKSLVAALTPAIDLFHLHSVERVGLRYINQWSIPVTAAGVEYHKYVHPPISTDTFKAHTPTSFLTEVSADLTNGRQLTIRSGLLPSQAGEPNRTYLLDLDCYSLGSVSLSTDGLTSMLSQFHDAIEGEFLSAVTEKYRRYMTDGTPL